MHCNQVHDHLDEYLDGELNGAVATALARHLDTCAGCAADYQSHRNMRAMLKRLPMETPDENFLARAVAMAANADEIDQAMANEHSRDHRTNVQQVKRPGFGFRSAIAAAFALVFFTVMLLTTGELPSTPSNGHPEVTLATNTVTPVKLLFESAETLRDARLSLQLPIGVELVGYNDSSDLSWTTDLEPGKNVLQLPLVGRKPGSNHLIAKLEHPKGTKTFQLRLTVQ